MRILLPFLLTLAAPATAAQVQPASAPRWNPKAPENAQLLPSFSYASVETVLDSIGARYQRAGKEATKPVLLVTFPNERKAVLTLSACGEEGACKALSIQSFWTRIARSPPQRTAAAIAGFNQHFSFAKAFVAADGRPALQRYLTADFGFVRGNLAVNLLVFARQAEQFAADVLKPLETPTSQAQGRARR